MSREEETPASILLVDDTPTNLEVLVDYFAGQWVRCFRCHQWRKGP